MRKVLLFFVLLAAITGDALRTRCALPICNPTDLR
jgi:hypothetical protein